MARGVLRTEGSWPSKPKTLPFEEPGSLRDNGRMTVKKLLERSKPLKWVTEEKCPVQESACGGMGRGQCLTRNPDVH